MGRSNVLCRSISDGYWRPPSYSCKAKCLLQDFQRLVKKITVIKQCYCQTGTKGKRSIVPNTKRHEKDRCAQTKVMG